MFILEVAMLLAGIYALVTGKVKLTKKIAAQGAAARLAGLVMMLPWPLSYCIGFAYGTYLVSRGQPIDRSNLLMVGTLIDLGCTAGCLAVAAVITLLGAQEEEEDTPALRRRYQKWADRSSGEGRKRPRVQTDEWGGEETPSRRPSAEKSDASQDEGDVDWEDVEATPSGKKPAVKSGPEPEEGIQAEPRPRQPILDVLPVEESVPESRRRRKSSDRGRPQARDSSRFWVELGVVAVCVFLLIGGAAFLWWSVRPFLPAQAKVARRPSSFVDPARTQPLPAPVPIQVNPQDRPPIFPRPQNFQPANPFPNPVAQAPMKPLRQGKRFHPSAVPGPKMDGSRFIPVQAQDLVYDPVRGQLYAAVGSTAENRPNTVTALDPATGNVLWSISVGSDPAVLALSDDASVLWVGLAGASAIQRVDLEHRQAGPLLPLKGNSFGSVFAETLAVVPGPSEAVVVSLYSKGVSPRFAGLVVVDRDRVGSATVPGLGSCNRLAYSDDAGTLFAYNNETTESGLRRLAVTEDGVYQQACYLGRFRGNADIIYAGGRIYSTRGEV
ncbi:MAG: hypothetical protein JO112_04550, partial [Planctomycetes bacterium]|nr:hypothetical protein [Planctomycetota bacterium]